MQRSAAKPNQSVDHCFVALFFIAHEDAAAAHRAIAAAHGAKEAARRRALRVVGEIRKSKASTEAEM